MLPMEEVEPEPLLRQDAGQSWYQTPGHKDPYNMHCAEQSVQVREVNKIKQVF